MQGAGRAIKIPNFSKKKNSGCLKILVIRIMGKYESKTH